jgi:O-antigen/teichoic acid export membrane protein
VKQSQRIVKNALSGVGAELIGGGLNFIALLIIARSAGVDGFGIFSFVLAFSGLFQLVADFGLSNILVREISTHRGQLDRYLGAAKSLIWILSFLTFAIMVGTIHLIGRSPEVVRLSYLMGLAVLAMFHVTGYAAVFRAFEVMELNALGFVLHKVFLLGCVLLTIFVEGGLTGFALSYLAANLALWGFNYLLVRRRYVRPRMIMDRPLWRELLTEAYPLGIGMILRRATWHVDSLLLTWLSLPSAVGLYNAAYRIIQSISLLPMALTIPLYPVFSRMAESSHETLWAAYQKSLKFLGIVSIPMAVGLSVLSERIIGLLYGEAYLPSAQALTVLSWVVVLLFPTSLYLYLYTALGRQRLYTFCVGASLGINIVLDLVLIPTFGFMGACYATLIAEIVLFGLGYYGLVKLGGPAAFWEVLWRPLAASSALGLVLYLLKDSTPGWILIGGFAGLILYGVLLLVFKTFSSQDWSLIKEGIGHRLTGSRPA